MRLLNKFICLSLFLTVAANSYGQRPPCDSTLVMDTMIYIVIPSSKNNILVWRQNDLDIYIKPDQFHHIKTTLNLSEREFKRRIKLSKKAQKRKANFLFDPLIETSIKRQVSWGECYIEHHKKPIKQINRITIKLRDCGINVKTYILPDVYWEYYSR